MQKIIKKKIGKDIHHFTVDGSNLHELIMNEQKLSFQDVDKCGMCGSDDLYFNARHSQNKFKYVEIKCRGCSAAVIFGSMMNSPDTYFLRKQKDKRTLDWQKPPLKKI